MYSNKLLNMFKIVSLVERGHKIKFRNVENATTSEAEVLKPLFQK
jgi:hypothetical protein